MVFMDGVVVRVVMVGEVVGDEGYVFMVMMRMVYE